MVHQVLQRFDFQFSSPLPTPLSTSQSLSAPPSDESVEPSGPYPELVGCLITSPLNSSTPSATTPTAATTATPTASTTIASKAPTPATTPTAATTSATSTTSTAATTTTPAATATTPASLALAVAALPTNSRSSPDIGSTKDVNSCSRGVGGGKGGGGTPLKEGRARSATSGTYSDYTSLSCKERVTYIGGGFLSRNSAGRAAR
ncbi:unnamed protein product [Closterium sp. NIES-54]